MYLHSRLFFVSCLFTTLVANNTQQVDILLEKVQQAKNKEEKKVFLEKLKNKLAKANKKASEESNAIIEAKKKLPQKIYDETKLK